MKVSKEVSRHMALLGKRSAKVRMRKIAPETRALIARNAAVSRWGRPKAERITEQLIDRWQQIKNEVKNEVISVGAVGSHRFEVRRKDLVGPTLMRMGDELLDITQVSQRLGVPKSTVYELTRNRGRVRHDHPLPSFKVGRRLKFNWSTVVAWLDTLEKEGAR